jgi:hypothetical protein
MVWAHIGRINRAVAENTQSWRHEYVASRRHLSILFDKSSSRNLSETAGFDPVVSLTSAHTGLFTFLREIRLTNIRIAARMRTQQGADLDEIRLERRETRCSTISAYTGVSFHSQHSAATACKSPCLA